MLQFIAKPAEQTTAVTDAILFVLCLSCAWFIHSSRSTDRFKVNLWSGALVALAAASLLGAAVHGLIMPASVKRLIWHPLNFALGFAVALFVCGAVLDFVGAAAARRLLPPLLGSALLFVAATLLTPDSFHLFIPYAAVCLIFALVVYLLSALRHQHGAVLMAAGILTTMLAVAVQANRAVNVRLYWQFDHNGMFHIIQMMGVLLITAGLCGSLRVVSQSKSE